MLKNAHEAIISKEDYEKLQRVEKGRKANHYFSYSAHDFERDYENRFKGLVINNETGKSLFRRTRIYGKNHDRLCYLFQNDTLTGSINPEKKVFIMEKDLDKVLSEKVSEFITKAVSKKSLVDKVESRFDKSILSCNKASYKYKAKIEKEVQVFRQSIKECGFGYGKGLTGIRFKDRYVMLPIDEKNNPNWHFMEEYIKERESKQRNDLKEYYKSRLLDLVICTEVLTDVEWSEFSLRDLFTFERGNQNNMSACEVGEIPLISAKKIDNGVKAFISDNGKKLFEGHILTLNNDGDGGGGIAYYQANKMALDTHVTALIPVIPINRGSLLFISKTITIQRDKFSHGYSLNNNRMKAKKIVLPIDKTVILIGVIWRIS